jgi:hypothetical protein
LVETAYPVRKSADFRNVLGGKCHCFHSTVFFRELPKTPCKNVKQSDFPTGGVLCPVLQWKERGIKILLICRIG